jgi:O-antigen biosynthesis protein WbqP
MYRNGIKRLLAILLSLCGMLVLSPLLLILCIAIKVDSPGPILFKQAGGHP